MATEAVMLDTSAYSAFRRGNPAVLDLLRHTPDILIPVTVLGELLAGFALGTRPAENRAALQAFLDRPRVRVVPTAETTAERYALIYSHARASGRPVPTSDLWIASSAMEHGVPLATLDAHFLTLPQIVVTFLAPE